MRGNDEHSYRLRRDIGHRAADQDHHRPAATSARTTSRSTSSSPASATPTSTPCAAEWGQPQLPGGRRATRSPVSSPRSAPRSPSTRSATASASAASSTPAASATTARPASSSTAPAGGMVGTYNGIGRDGTADLRRLQRQRSSSTRTTCCASPTGIAAGQGRTAAVRGHHHLLTAAPLGCRPRQARSPSSASAASATWRVKLAIGDGRGGHRAVSQSLKKMEDGLRLGADRVLRHQRRRHLQEAARTRST